MVKVNKEKNWVELNFHHFIFPFLVLFGTCQTNLSAAPSQELLVGVASVDITPALPAAADGQMRLRVAEIAETPLTANVIVLESNEMENGQKKNSVLVSCDLVTIPYELRDMIREAVAKAIPQINTKKIIINATHTHTGGVIRDGWYTIPDSVTQA
ncbi:MAG: hypothetical protein WD431_09640, partial [Cyclobacteriaceae bacterium]